MMYIETIIKIMIGFNNFVKSWWAIKKWLGFTIVLNRDELFKIRFLTAFVTIFALMYCHNNIATFENRAA
jgi:hypothetical protein